MNLIKITLASLAGLVLIAPTSSAQEPVRTKEKPKVERQKRQKPAPQVRGKEQKGDKRPDAKRPEKGPETRPEGRPNAKDPKGKKPTEAEMVRFAREEEAKHRERLAKAKRLAELAQKSGDRDKIAKIEALVKAENARYDREVAKAKRVLGEAKFNEIHAKMGKDPKGGKRPEVKRPEKTPDAKRPQAKRPEKTPEGRSKDTPKERP